jgi:hypothetical protein
MGDLPMKKWKRVFKVVKNAKFFQSDLIVMDNLPKWKMRMIFQSGEKYE